MHHIKEYLTGGGAGRGEIPSCQTYSFNVKFKRFQRSHFYNCCDTMESGLLIALLSSSNRFFNSENLVISMELELTGTMISQPESAR